ncbi:MAG: aminoglycoside phosphotransferase family protein, partial [Jiangellaceae bacterium]
DALLDRAVGVARELSTASGDGPLIHADLHYENVLATLAGTDPQRGSWVAIDPKPMAGDPEFAVLPMLWNRLDELDGSDQEAALLRRLEALVDAAGLDMERARAWSLVRVVETVVWNAETGLVQQEHRPG